MNPVEDSLLAAIETHSPDGIRQALDAGLDARAPVRGKTPLVWLTSMYTRSDRFPDCVRVLLERGATLPDRATAAVLLDDPGALAVALDDDPKLVSRRATMESSFTPLVGATLLHVAAEYGHENAARVLLEAGADVDARAARDAHGLNGHTPLFHTVNSARNRSAGVMRMLLDAGARVDVHLDGIVWGAGFDWETVCLDVTPVSYAQLGLLPQMHRRQEDVYETVSALLDAAGRPVPPFDNVPNRYLS